MCATIGVDPLASSKGFWSEMLGFGDYYYELAVQIIEICMAASHRTGGLLEAGELRQRLIKSRGTGRQNKNPSQNKTQVSKFKFEIIHSTYKLITNQDLNKLKMKNIGLLLFEPANLRLSLVWCS